MRFAIGIVTAIASAAISTVCHGVDLQPSFDPGTDSGLFVWRTWSGDWQLRVLAADATRRVAGVFETGQPVSAHQRLALESGDLVDVSEDHTVRFDVQINRATVDGLSFTAGTGGVCLRVDSIQPIYLGRDRVLAQSPVDLTENGACARRPAEQSALALTRSSQTEWRVRLAPAEGQSRFEGRLEFSEPVVSYVVDSLEGDDRVELPQPDRLELRLTAWGGHYDEVSFVMTESSRICLRSGSAREQVVSLAGKGQQPVAATTPVDLTNNGACGLPTDPFPPPTFGRKYHPGHYVVLTTLDDEVSMAESLVQGVVGFVQRYTWRQLEPSPGVYDFSAIEADLTTVSSFGTQLIAQIEDKSFEPRLPTPDYLQSRTLPNIPGGYSVVRWDPYVVTRYKALIAALGEHFDAHPRFEGIATTESAHGLDAEAMAATGYSAERYRDVLIDELVSASASLPRSRVFWFMNFLWGGNHYLGDIARVVAAHGVSMGGPDVLPDSVALNRHPYPFYHGAMGLMPLFGQVEPSCYHHPHADPEAATLYWTPQELFEYARDDLHVSYLFWVRWRWRPDPESFNWWDAIPVIENHPLFNR